MARGLDEYQQLQKKPELVPAFEMNVSNINHMVWAVRMRCAKIISLLKDTLSHLILQALLIYIAIHP